MPSLIEKVLHYPDGSCSCPLLLTDLGGSQYRLEQFDPLEEFDFHDIVHGEQRPDGGLDFVRIVEHSDCKTYSWLLVEELVESHAMERVFSEVVSLGGYAESYFVGCVYIAVPKDVVYDPYEKLREYGSSAFNSVELKASKANIIGKWFEAGCDRDHWIHFRQDGTFKTVNVMILDAGEPPQYGNHDVRAGRWRVLVQLGMVLRFVFRRAAPKDSPTARMRTIRTGRYAWLAPDWITMWGSTPGEWPVTKVKVEIEGNHLSIPRADGSVLCLRRYE